MLTKDECQDLSQRYIEQAFDPMTANTNAPHIHTAWSHNPPYTVSQYAERVVFLSLGLSVGLIAAHERRLTTRHRETADALARAQPELREEERPQQLAARV